MYTEGRFCIHVGANVYTKGRFDIHVRVKKTPRVGLVGSANCMNQ